MLVEEPDRAPVSCSTTANPSATPGTGRTSGVRELVFGRLERAEGDGRGELGDRRGHAEATGRRVLRQAERREVVDQVGELLRASGRPADLRASSRLGGAALDDLVAVAM